MIFFTYTKYTCKIKYTKLIINWGKIYKQINTEKWVQEKCSYGGKELQITERKSVEQKLLTQAWEKYILMPALLNNDLQQTSQTNFCYIKIIILNFTAKKKVLTWFIKNVCKWTSIKGLFVLDSFLFWESESSSTFSSELFGFSVILLVSSVCFTFLYGLMHSDKECSMHKYSLAAISNL